MLHVGEALLNSFLFGFIRDTVWYVKHDQSKRFVVGGQVLGVTERSSGTG